MKYHVSSHCVLQLSNVVFLINDVLLMLVCLLLKTGTKSHCDSSEIVKIPIVSLCFVSCTDSFDVVHF